MIIEAVLPGVPVEGLVERIHQLLVLELQRREIELDVLVEVLLDATVLRNGEDRGVAIGISGQCLADVDAESTSDQALLRGDRRDDLLAHAALVQRCHALLTVKQELLRTRLQRG